MAVLVAQERWFGSDAALFSLEGACLACTEGSAFSRDDCYAIPIIGTSAELKNVVQLAPLLREPAAVLEYAGLSQPTASGFCAPRGSGVVASQLARARKHVHLAVQRSPSLNIQTLCMELSESDTALSAGVSSVFLRSAVYELALRVLGGHMGV